MPSNGCMQTQRIRQLLMHKGDLMFSIILFILVFLICISQPYSLKGNKKHSHAIRSRSWLTGLNIEQKCHILGFWLSPTLINSRHLQSHLQSCVATKSLCQGSGYVSFHYYRQFIYILVFHNSCTLVTPTLSTMNSLFSVDTLHLMWTSFVICSPFYLFLYSLTLA